MINTTNKILITFSFLILISFLTKGQTNVSGIIDTNTTWTKANSPYIVVDTVFLKWSTVLTIEPGVIIKFEHNKSIVIGYGKIIAEGILTDSITFTNNSITPVLHTWEGINFDESDFRDTSKFNYCNFSYANNSLTSGYNNYSTGGMTIIINNSSFYNNNSGIFTGDNAGMYYFIDSCSFQYNNRGIKLSHYGCLKISNSKITQNGTGVNSAVRSKIENCIIDSNYSGILSYSNYDTIINCEIKYNRGTGIEESGYGPNSLISNNVIENNNLGFLLRSIGDSSNISIICNRICNNTTYDFDIFTNEKEINIFNNNWCTNDSAIIATHIHDGNDQNLIGFANFIPFDTLQCYLNTGIQINETENKLFEFFPNPADEYLKLKMKLSNSTSILKIYNIFGELEFSSNIKENETIINISTLSIGIHIIELTISGKSERKKFIKQ